MQTSMGRGGYNGANKRSVSSTPISQYMQGRGGYNDTNDGENEDGARLLVGAGGGIAYERIE